MIIAVMCVRNEEYHLPTFLKHLRKYVDGFVVLDDGSTDNTLDILKNEPKMLKIIKRPVTNKLDWDEKGNRKKLLKETYKISKDKDNTWVLCCDPDERFETRFLKRLRDLTNEKKVYGVHFRELFGDKNHYRCDGIWNGKLKYIFFPLSKKMDFDSTYIYRHHIPWYYAEISNNLELLEYNLYHFKMLKSYDRLKRADLYNKLDPDKKMQPVGYDYLYDLNGIKLQKVKFKNRYDYKNIPDDLKKFSELKELKKNNT